MIKLSKGQKWLLLLLVIYYILSIQLIAQSLVINEIDDLDFTNVFRDENTLILFVNTTIVIFSIILLLFQSFIYRLLILLFKVERFPSLMKSAFYLFVGYVPFIALTILIYFLMGGDYLVDIVQTPFFRVGNIFIVNLIYVLLVLKGNFLELRKTIVFGVMLISINSLLLLFNF
ncbi:hypothetical protein SAMN05421734_11022 [Pelagirhabdus alkalitolerans]|uniref:Yip1 domain-containing protein n=1 Tax=Pelagirhabdus alkalitolerans TaxID=1612202 RepID=A0A1G6M3M3_9BACI|nr:hypothetical protein [Pelagirhabdus alkalitolerans]SDC50113.1 hypothetical protein SAMN05421734_11022 [Pelagirhabdus alkalitolerans]